jgi:hypothetical protein
MREDLRKLDRRTSGARGAQDVSRPEEMARAPADLWRSWSSSSGSNQRLDEALNLWACGAGALHDARVAGAVRPR